MSKTARDVMSGGAECVGERETVLDAARKMSELDVGALPICGDDDRLKGMLTDRDIVIRVLAQGKDPGSTTAGGAAGMATDRQAWEVRGAGREAPAPVTAGPIDEARRFEARRRARSRPGAAAIAVTLACFAGAAVIAGVTAGAQYALPFVVL